MGFYSSHLFVYVKMRFHISGHLEYAITFPSTLILNIHAQRSASQTILEENFTVEPYLKVEEFLSDNGDLLRQVCLRGAGIGNFYRFHVQNDLESGGLVRILPSFEVKPRNVYAVLPHRQIMRPQAKAFVEFARNLGVVS